MRRVIATLAVLALCLGTAWAEPPGAKVSPSDPGISPGSQQLAARSGAELPAEVPWTGTLPGRAQMAPLAAAPLDDGGVSAELAAGAEAGGPRATKNVPGDYATIQLAVAWANGNAGPDTITVDAGTYTETGQIAITDDLTIVGDPANKPVVKPASDTTCGGNVPSEAFIYVASAVTLTLADFEIDGSGRLVHHAIQSRGSLTLSRCTIHDVRYAQYLGRAVVLYKGTALIEDCSFFDIERIGVHVRGAVEPVPPTAAIRHCSYTGKGAGLHLDYAFELGGGGTATITNSSATACTGVAGDLSTSAGILITTYFGTGTAGTVLGNKLTGNTTALAVGYNSADTSTVVAHYNDVSGCTEGIWNTSSTNPVNAEKNWWGTTNAATITTLIGGLVDYTPYLFTDRVRLAFGGNRLASTQNPDGGWGWPLSGGSAVNTVGPIAMGLSKAYRATSDPDLRAALQKAGTFLLAKTNNFSPSDGYLAAELDAIFGGTTYLDHLNTKFYGPLAAGTYNRNGLGPLYNTAGYVTLIRTDRANQGIPNLAAWDLGMGLVAAASAGVTGTELGYWIAGVKAEINELDGTKWYDVIGLAGALYGLAFVDEEFDPTAGEHAAASSLNDLADILTGYQIVESGGFAWNKNYVIPYDYNETVQETGYAILALEEMGGYDAETSDAKDWLLSFQLETGGWMNYGGSSSENNEVTAEALWGVWASAPATLTLEPDDECYANAEPVIVELWMNDVPQTIVGGQFFLKYDNSKLTFVSAVAQSPFANVYLNTSVPGLIDYSVGITPPGSTTGDAKMAVLTFQAIGAICTEPDLITWRPHDPPTRLTTSVGAEPVYPLLVDMDVIDDVPPTITCPANVTVECDVAPMGWANGGILVMYNNYGPEVPANQAWFRAQFSQTNANGAVFNFEPGPTGYGALHPFQVHPDQFGLDFTLPAPTYLGGNPPLVWFNAKDNVNGTCAGATNAGPVAWAISGYIPSPTDPAGCVVNSIMRSVVPPNVPLTEVVLTNYVVTQSGSVWTMSVEGYLVSDGLFHWYNPALPHTPMSNFGLNGRFHFRGVLKYNSQGDPGNDGDFYAGAMVLYPNALPASTGWASATDNCDPGPIITFTDTFVAGSCPQAGTITRTWKAQDACGNSSQCVQIITVQDNTAPTITCPADFAVQCAVDVPAPYADLAAFLAAGGTADDNCDTALTLSLTSDTGLVGGPCGGTVTRVYRVTDDCNNYAECTQIITVDDTIAPTITCPPGISVNADAGYCTARINLPAPATLWDNCDPNPTYTYWIGATQIYSPHTFPGGTTIVTIKAKDWCNNESTCNFDVTVSAFNELVVNVQLSPTMVAGPITRCITFELWNCSTLQKETVNQVLAFTNGLASNVTVLVPCAKGPFTCITARDTLHTLRRTDEAFGISGTQYVADFTGDPVTSGDWLIGGNLNDDRWIDVLDFGVYSWQWSTNYGTGNTTCTTPYPHADVNGSAIVDLADFTFIQINFLKGHEANCCGQPGDEPEAGPITEISVADLVALGMPELAAGDLNGDGWLDEQDIVAFFHGARPNQQADREKAAPAPAQRD